MASVVRLAFDEPAGTGCAATPRSTLMLRKQTAMVLALIAAAFPLAACGAPDRTSAQAGPTSAAVTDCGTFSLGQGEGLPESALTCFIDGFHAARPTRLTVTAPTTEGDPISTSYAAGADGRI
jgi:hypothetical protein